MSITAVHFVNWVFWLSLILLIWQFIGYPALLLLITFKSLRRTPREVGAALPRVSIMILAYNEAAVIAKKIENTLSLTYPPELLEVLVVDSASNDGTSVVVSQYTDRGVKYISQKRREGKASAIQFGIAHARHEVIVATDANAFFAPDVLQQTMRYFNNPEIGGVTAAMHQRAGDQGGVSFGGGLYWRVEQWLRGRESRIHSVIGMSGEFAAFRASIFRSVPLNAWYIPGSADDFSMSLYIIRSGKRIAYVSDASVWERAPSNPQDLLKQKVRIITQTLVNVFHRLPAGGHRPMSYFWFIYPSHKVLPLFAPLLLLFLLVTSAGLTAAEPNVLISIVLILQVIIYLFAALHKLVLKSWRISQTCYFFFLIQWSIILGWRDYLLKKDYTVWDKISTSRV